MTPWIEAMRLRTLPVSISGVILGAAMSASQPHFLITPLLLCLVFALLAQIASNFANEYYDYRDGLDRKGRSGPRRGVTEGDITPRAMLTATFITLGLACAVGLSLIYFGGWWLLPAGIVIALGALAYSAGPYPLSRHALGEVAVLIFFGIVPVNLTYYLSAECFSVDVALLSVSAGLMGCNVLIANNYRDVEDDAAVGKITLAVKFGRPFTAALYLADGLIAAALTVPVALHVTPWTLVATGIYLIMLTVLHRRLIRSRGAALIPVLARTAMSMALFSLIFLLITLLIG